MLHVKTMLGLGDAFAARPTIAALLRKDCVALETPWPEVFIDLLRECYCGPSESFFIRPSNLNIRCAARNVEESKVDWQQKLTGATRVQLSYSLHKDCKSIPEQIAGSAGVLAEAKWSDIFWKWPFEGYDNDRHRSPLGVFRVPTIRTEYHNVARNPAPGLVAAAVDEIGGDWIHLNDIGESELPLHEDMIAQSFECTPRAEASHGQLSLPSMLDLVARARCVVTPPSWMMWAAIAYQATALIVWGGYASPETILGPFAKSMLIVVPANPCWCFNPKHACSKAADVEALRRAARGIVK
jgi:hypothetical protein